MLEVNDRVRNILALNPAIRNYDGVASVLNVSRDPERTTERYQETDDLAVLELLNERGWKCTDYKQVKAQNSSKAQYKPYMATFTNDSLNPFPGEGNLTIIQSNAKDGTKCHKYNVGFLRAICENGWIAGQSLFDAIRVKHIGNVPATIDQILLKVLDACPDVYDRISAMKQVEINRDQQVDFAKKAIVLRFGEEDKYAVDPMEVLNVRRSADEGNGLWEVTNRVQENLIKAGNFLITTSNGRKRKASRVNNIDLTFKINKGIWDLAESYIQ